MRNKIIVEGPKKERATFVFDRELLKKFKDFCYTERINQSEGIDMAVRMFLADVSEEEIIKRPERR